MSEPPAAEQPKVGAKNAANGADGDADSFELHDLRTFRIISTLQNQRREKLVTLHGRFETEAAAAAAAASDANGDASALNSSDAVLLLEKAAFSSDMSELCHVAPAELHAVMKNDVYYRYRLTPSGPATAGLTQLQLSVIHPCSQRHIDKYSAQQLRVLVETGAEHLAVVRPHLLRHQMQLDWVYNALEKRAEVERTVFEDAHPDTGFLMQRDFKWDGVQLPELYCLALAQRRDLMSLRDLRACHLPLLRNIRDKGAAAIEQQYGVPREQLLIYFHYQPSFYHLHVHFTHCDGEWGGQQCHRAHLIDNVISNLQLCDDFYERSDLTFALPQSSDLLKELVNYRQNGPNQEE